MKSIYLLLILILSMSCNTLKSNQDQPICPEGYTCQSEILENKKLSVLEDTIGKTYLQIEKSDDSMVYKYSYSYKGDPRLADDGYEEIIYIELPSDIEQDEYQDKELSKVKLYLQKSCFCRDGGFESIDKGILKVTKSKSKYIIDLNFESEREVKLSKVYSEVKL